MHARYARAQHSHTNHAQHARDMRTQHVMKQAEFKAEGWSCSVDAFDVTDEAAVDAGVANPFQPCSRL